jgi:hypothetical protein
MRCFVVAVTLLLCTSPLFAADGTTADYSASAMRQILVSNGDDQEPPLPRPTDRFHAGLGYLGWRAFGIDWKFYYIPMLMPFSGSVRYSDPSSKWPDPFAETNSKFAETPRTWHDTRELSKERKRIESLARIQAKP